MERYNMKLKTTLFPGLMTAAVLLCAPIASAQGGQYDWDNIDWEEKQGYALLDAYGGGWDFLYGFGGHFGLEACSKTFRLGLGARTGFSFWAGEDDLNWDYSDFCWDNDVWIPLRITDAVTLYGGIGVTLHDMDCDGLVESQSYYRNGRSYRYRYQLKTVTYISETPSDNQVWFVGLRMRFEHYFLFGEYRRTSGEIELTTDDLSYNSKLKTMKLDMDQSQFYIGAGIVF